MSRRGPSQAGQTEKALEAEDPGHQARSVFLFSSQGPETGLGVGRGRQRGWHSQRGCPHPQSRACGPLPFPGLYTAYTAHLHRDKALLRRLLKVPLGVGCSLWEGYPGLVLWLSPGDPHPQGLQKKRPSDVQTAVLRRHLLELTQSFIIPLVRPARGGGQGAGSGPDSLPPRPQEHYMASLMPLQKGIVPWKVWSQEGRGCAWEVPRGDS